MKSETLELVRATLQDKETYILLEKAVAGTKLYSALLTDTEVLDEIQNKIVYLIKRGAQVMGSISYEIKGPDHAYIDGLVVHPSFQGQGIGREALGILLKELERYKRVDLVTHPDNARAIRLYESFGFKIGERIENYFGDGESRTVLARENK